MAASTTVPISSCCSSPPSEAMTEHEHILPPGWTCKFVPQTKKYYFVPSDWMLFRDDALFCRLKSNFPDVDSNVIWTIMFREKNVEHECISSLLAHQRGSLYVLHSRTSPKMKLRYLQRIYPDVEENFLFDLLQNCDDNAMHVIERLEQMGYRRKELDFSRPPLAPKLVKISPPGRESEFPINVSDKEKMAHDVCKSFPKVDRKLVVSALECSGYKKDTATTFLEAMTPQDSEKYFPKIPPTPSPPPIIRPCTGTQTKALIDSITGTPVKIKYFVGSAPEVTIDASTDRVTMDASTDRVTMDASTDRVTMDASTCTTLDGIIQPKQRQVPLAKGPDVSLRRGPEARLSLKLKLDKGPDPSLRRGPASFSLGPNGPSVTKCKIEGAKPGIMKGADVSFRIVKQVQELSWDE